MSTITNLFLIVMTALFHDAHRETNEQLRDHRVPGADFDEVTYADDTICITRDTEAKNEFVKNIDDMESDAAWG